MHFEVDKQNFRVLNEYSEENRRNFAKDMKYGVCKWCGQKFIKSANKEAYCSDVCRESARSEQCRSNSRRWYHSHKHELNEKQRWGLGSGSLGQHRNKDFNREFDIVRKELSRLNIRKK